MRFMAWQRAPVDVMRLALGCVIRNGIRRIWVAESMNDVETDLRIARIAKQEGADEVLVGLVYSISPVHTDAYYAARAREIAASADVDVLNLKDPGGLLTPERVRTLVPALRAAAPSLPLEVHSHCTATMAPLVYLEAARLGASFVCTAVRPLANGTSQPSAEQTLANLRGEGFDVPLDDDALAEMSEYFTALAARIGRPVGAPAEYDVSIYRHQLPGGMTSTLRRQLREVGQEARWDEVLAEIPRVREELGWPIMVTPLSQFVGVQAFLNVTTGARYSQIPDEVVKYVLGQYGPPPGELDPAVTSAVLASPKAGQFQGEEQPPRPRRGARPPRRCHQRRVAAAADDAARGAGRRDAGGVTGGRGGALAASRGDARRRPHAAAAARARPEGARRARARQMSLLSDIDAVVFDVDGTLLHANDPSGRARRAPDRRRRRDRGARPRKRPARALLHERHGPPAGAVRGGHPLPRLRDRRRGVHEPGRGRRALDRAPPPREVGARARRPRASSHRSHELGIETIARSGAGGRRRRARRLGRRDHLRRAARGLRVDLGGRAAARDLDGARSSRSTAGAAPGWSGAIAAGIRQTTGARAVTLGKPSPIALREMCRALGVEPARTLVVGDDLALEIAMARRAGARSALVLTGVGTEAEAAACPPARRPDAVLADVSALAEAR